ncbi:TPA: hypothetical protein ACJ2X1_004540, partial [Yersinia enterocolitica]
NFVYPFVKNGFYFYFSCMIFTKVIHVVIHGTSHKHEHTSTGTNKGADCTRIKTRFHLVLKIANQPEILSWLAER